MNINTKISTALAVAAISAAFMGYSTSANAAGSLRDTCTGKTRNAVVRCCNTWVGQHGRPIWMGEGGCRAAAACSSGGKSINIGAVAYVQKAKCFLEEVPPSTYSSDNPQTSRTKR